MARGKTITAESILYGHMPSRRPEIKASGPAEDSWFQLAELNRHNLATQTHWKAQGWVGTNEWMVKTSKKIPSAWLWHHLPPRSAPDYYPMLIMPFIEDRSLLNNAIGCEIKLFTENSPLLDYNADLLNLNAEIMVQAIPEPGAEHLYDDDEDIVASAAQLVAVEQLAEAKGEWLLANRSVNGGIDSDLIYVSAGEIIGTVIATT